MGFGSDACTMFLFFAINVCWYLGWYLKESFWERDFSYFTVLAKRPGGDL